jgi:hypothetical protein
MKKSFEEKIYLIDNLEVVLNFVCPIVQLICMVFVVFICENAKIDTCLVCFQLFLLSVQFLLPKLLKKVVMKKRTKELIEKIEDDVNLYL